MKADVPSDDEYELAAISALNALDLALESQKLELEAEKFVKAFLPLMEAVESLCRGLQGEDAQTVLGKVEALSLLPETAEVAAAKIGLVRDGRVGELVDRSQQEVVDTELRSDLAHGTILDVVKAGWLLRGKVLQRAKVVASRRELEER